MGRLYLTPLAVKTIDLWLGGEYLLFYCEYLKVRNLACFWRKIKYLWGKSAF